MGRRHKLLQKILGGHSDANIRFNEMRRLLKKLGFVERVRGSHHVFVRGDIAERVILQRDGKRGKPYQIRQVRRIVLRNGLGIEE